MYWSIPYSHSSFGKTGEQDRQVCSHLTFSNFVMKRCWQRYLDEYNASCKEVGGCDMTLDGGRRSFVELKPSLDY